MGNDRRIRSAITGLVPILAMLSTLVAVPASDGVFVRFKLGQPRQGTYYVRLAGHIHNSPWHLPRAVIPAGADKVPVTRISAGQFTPWFDLGKHAGDHLHGRLNRAGGVAEFPNVTAEFVLDPPAERCHVTIQMATADRAENIVKQWRESFVGSSTSFLVSSRPTWRRTAQTWRSPRR